MSKLDPARLPTISAFHNYCRQEVDICSTAEELGHVFARLHADLNRPQVSTRIILKLNSILLDSLLARALAIALTHLQADALIAEMAVVAIGGYGREETYPLSDIDVALITTGDDAYVGPLSMIYERILRQMRAAKPQIGLDYDYRNLSCIGNLEHRSLTALLDMRHICGNPAVFTRYQEALRVEISTQRAKFIRDKYEERNGIIENWGGSSDQTRPPNVKNGFGGLREFQSTVWIGRARYGVGDREVWRHIENNGIATWAELEAAFNCRPFLQRVRVHLHINAGYYENSLRDADVRVLARQFGYQDSLGCRADDAFIADCRGRMALVGSLFKRVRAQLAAPVISLI